MTDGESRMKVAARAKVYQFLALAFADPNPATRARVVEGLDVARHALAVLEDADGLEALEAVGWALGKLREGEFEEAHIRCFGHTAAGDCPPYEAEYGQAHIFQKSHSLADISGFYKAFGLEPAPNLHERWDHLSVELEFMHFLVTKEAYALAKGHGEERLALVRAAQAMFLEEHLGRWAAAFARRLEGKAGDGPYAALARLLRAFLTSEFRLHGVEPEPADIVRVAPPRADTDPRCEGCTARSLEVTVE